MELQILEKLEKLSEDSSALKGQIRDLRTIMMGDGTAETPFGRLPMTEKGLKELEIRVGVLEKAQVRYGVYGNIFGGVGGFVAGLIGSIVTVLAGGLFKMIVHK